MIRPSSLFVLIALALLSASGSAQTGIQRERVAAAFMLGLGRAPAAEEMAQWSKQETASIPGMLSRLAGQLEGDPAGKTAVAARAFEDAFGRAPHGADLEDEEGHESGSTYTELMKSHLQSLTAHPAEYEEVIQRAYKHVIRREAYAEEIDYWKQKGTFSHVLLVGCVEDWARRNQPGLMVTSGTPTISVNSEFLTTVRLSPAVAAEARAAAGLEPAGDSGSHLIAVGAGGILTGGRIHFAVAGPDRTQG